jgi:ferredoxin
MTKFKIIHEIDQCIGCGACTTSCGKFWEMNGDKSHLKGSKKVGSNFELVVVDIACNQDAVDTCPVSCIKIEKMK